LDGKRAGRGSQDPLVHPYEERYNSLMLNRVRAPIAAGTFYPADQTALRATVDDLLGKTLQHATGLMSAPAGLIVPHAGYSYSGGVAAAGYRCVAGLGRPELVVLLGANHTGLGEPMSLSDDDAWETPLGCSPLDRPFVGQLTAAGIPTSAEAFEREHSMEVQLPFIQAIWGCDVPIVPICITSSAVAAMEERIEAIAQAIGDRQVLMVASSDFTHYEPDAMARELDRLALGPIQALAPGKFAQVYRQRRLSICGAGAILTLLKLCLQLGLHNGELVQYETSADVTGDRGAVVGYASVLFKMEGS